MFHLTYFPVHDKDSFVGGGGVIPYSWQISIICFFFCQWDPQISLKISKTSGPQNKWTETETYLIQYLFDSLREKLPNCSFHASLSLPPSLWIYINHYHSFSVTPLVIPYHYSHTWAGVRGMLTFLTRKMASHHLLELVASLQPRS